MECVLSDSQNETNIIILNIKIYAVMRGGDIMGEGGRGAGRKS